MASRPSPPMRSLRSSPTHSTDATRRSPMASSAFSAARHATSSNTPEMPPPQVCGTSRSPPPSETEEARPMDIKTTLLSTGSFRRGSWPACYSGGPSRSFLDCAEFPTRPTSRRCRTSTEPSSTPAFIIPFMGIPLVLGGAAIVHFRAGDTRRGWLLAAATLTYVLGVLGVTMGRNVPLNDALDAFDMRQLPRARSPIGVRTTSRRGIVGTTCEPRPMSLRLHWHRQQHSSPPALTNAGCS